MREITVTVQVTDSQWHAMKAIGETYQLSVFDLLSTAVEQQLVQIEKERISRMEVRLTNHWKAVQQECHR